MNNLRRLSTKAVDTQYLKGILVEQYFDFAFGLADQIYAMMRGEIVYEGRKSKISKAKLRKSVGV